MSDIQRNALARDLASRLHAASHDELRVLDRLLTRLELGRERYGELELRRDRRDWRREAREELLDLVLYDAMDEIATEDRERAELHEAARDEMVPRAQAASAPDDDPAREWGVEAGTVLGAVPAAVRASAERSDPYETVVVDVEGPAQ